VSERVDETVLVAGAGLAGSLMAIYLARAGYQVKIYESRADPRVGDGPRGRSINLAISTRGIEALRGVGLAEEILGTAVPMRGRMIHAIDGRLTFQPYGTERDHVINSVSRLGLNIALLNAAERHPNVRLHFERRVVDVDLDRPGMELRRGDGAVERAEGDHLIGADGAFSRVRHRMQRLDRFNYRQSYLAHGYKELTIPPGEAGAFRLEKNALHIWPRGGYMMIALPNEDGSFTCTLFWPLEGANSFAELKSADQVGAYFRSEFPDAVPLMPTLQADYLSNPTSTLVTIRCRPWRVEDRVGLIGDACHAVVPFYGQGANAAFEDCLVLDRCLRENHQDWNAALTAYEAIRKPNVDVLADLAIENFLEMRDHVASRAFLVRKSAEKLLHRAFPAWFLPLYSMVTFSQVPYGAALRRARRQWRAVAAIGGVLIVGLLILVTFGLLRLLAG
jgi:kynurenine 3-monooxygenase